MIECLMEMLEQVISGTIIGCIGRFAHSIYDGNSRSKLYRSFQSTMQHIGKAIEAFKQNSKRIFLNYMNKCKRVLNPGEIKRVKEMMYNIHTKGGDYYIKEDKLSEGFRITVKPNGHTYIGRLDSGKEYSNGMLGGYHIPKYLNINGKYLHTGYIK